MSGRRTMGGSAGGGKGGRGGSIKFTRNEPAFLRRMKEEVGYKETVPDIDSKNSDNPTYERDQEGDEERPDELPTVVVLKKGDLTAEEALKEAAKLDKDDQAEEAVPSDGRIMFKKPTNKRPVEDEKDASDGARKKGKAAPSKSLLSFDVEEDDEDG